MTQEDKELLLKDLCDRLPYLENWVWYDGKDYVVTGYGHGRVSLLPSMFSSGVGPCPLVEEVKPYLRPMSSMTNDEMQEFLKMNVKGFPTGQLLTWFDWCDFYRSGVYDWLNAHHFDYRGLIEKGLAFEAPEDMYKTE